MVNESTIKTFLVLVRVGSFTEAARQLYLSQQAVSKQIAKLEQDLGCVLIERKRGKLTLTEVGEIYYKAFGQIDSILTRAHREAAKLSDGQSSALSIGQPELLDLQEIYRKVMRTFQVQNPQVQMTYRSTDAWRVVDWLEEGKLDAAFALDNEVAGRKGLAWVPIEQIEEVLVVAADHPRATEDATYLDFREETVFYTLSPGLSEGEQRLRMESVGFPSDRLMATENLLSTCASVEQLQGVTFLLERCRLLRDKAFRTYPSHQRATLVLAYRKDNKKRALRMLVETAKQRSK